MFGFRAAALAGALAGCVTQSMVDVREPAPVGRPVAMRVGPCVDRTGGAGRNLGQEATQAFEERLGASSEFVLKGDARFHLACEVIGFVEGSAVKRWLMPGWGATVGRIAAMVTDTATGDVVVLARGDATVSSGGFYTIGADTYILSQAVDEVVRQLRAWASGTYDAAPAMRGGS
jgi:hypothetical protein